MNHNPPLSDVRRHLCRLCSIRPSSHNEQNRRWMHLGEEHFLSCLWNHQSWNSGLSVLHLSIQPLARSHVHHASLSKQPFAGSSTGEARVLRTGRLLYPKTLVLLSLPPILYQTAQQGRAIPDKSVKGTSVVLSEHHIEWLLAGQKLRLR